MSKPGLLRGAQRVQLPRRLRRRILRNREEQSLSGQSTDTEELAGALQREGVHSKLQQRFRTVWWKHQDED